MSMDEDNYLVPQYLDAPPRLFFWEVDEFLAMMVPLGIGIVVGQVILGVIGLLYTRRFVARLKAGRGGSVVRHALYWYLPSNVVAKLRKTPPSYIREYVG